MGWHQTEQGREYHKAYMKERYKADPDYFKQAARRQNEKLKAYVDQVRDVPCMDCRNKFPVVCMDFDHRDADDKLTEVSRLIRMGSMKKLKEEIAKCDVVCSNCHRIRTANRRIALIA